MINKLIFIFLTFFISNVIADGTSNQFNQFKTYAKNFDSQPASAAKLLSGNEISEHYTNNPVQANNYAGVKTTQSSIESNSIANLHNDTAGETAYNAFSTREKFSINKSDPEIQAAKIIESDSYNITHGISDNKINCHQEPVNCHVSYQTKLCLTGHPVQKYCVSSLVPETIHQSKIKEFNGNASMISIEHLRVNGTITSISLNYQINGKSDSTPFTVTAYIAGQVIQSKSITIPSNVSFARNDLHIAVTTDQPIILSLSGYFKNLSSVSGQYHIEVKTEETTTQLIWENSCNNISSECSLTAHQCSFGQQTKIINGKSYNESCWQYHDIYTCGQPESNSCLNLIGQGCQQINSLCKTYSGNQCIQYQDSYQCPVNQCPMKVVCLNNTFCSNGNCTQHISTQNKNFGKDVSELAAVGKGAEDANKTNDMTLFSGHPLSCRKKPLGYINCCVDKGWGKNIHLAHCSEDEKQLGYDKEHYLATYIGEYCSHRLPIVGTCTDHKKVYCVFDSKMSRIIQEQGRLAQLGQTMGTPSAPNCNGISLEDFQRLNLDEINFQNPVYPYPDGTNLDSAGIIDDLNPQFPTNQAVIDRIKEHLNNLKEAKV